LINAGAAPSTQQPAIIPAQRALTTRYLDFWLLGGASVLMWAFVVALNPLRAHSWAVAHHFNNLAALSATLALLVNYPHFMASYVLAYGQGCRYALRHWYQLIAVPAGLSACMIAGYSLYQDQETGHAFLQYLAFAAHFIGLQAPIGQSPTAGKEMMGLLVNFMFFTVGWHYSKQVYGCMMVYASYDGYKLTARQRQLLKASVFTIWAVSYTNANLGTAFRDYFGVPYLSLGLPSWTYYGSLLLFVCSFLGVAYFIGLRNYEQQGRWPSLNFLIPYLAFVVWWVPPLVHPEFFVLAVPFFHSLQYLPFVARVERKRLEAQHAPTTVPRGTMIALGLILAGFLTFELIPNTLDAQLGTSVSLNAWFFFVCAQLFINIHHYFIDNVIWRFSNPRVREYLLA
jgi:hypothetical protein